VQAIDVCASAGGLSLGLQRAGFDVLGVERDPVAVEVHRRHVGPCELADVETWHPSESVDLVAGGVPCQPFSAAGKGLGLYDPRGSLFRHLVRIAVEADARAVLLENVRGLVRWQRGRALREIEACMREAGFARVAWTVLRASHYGVPQARDRLFVVGLRGPGAPFVWPTPTTSGGLWSSRGEPTMREALGLEGDYYVGRDDGARGWNGMRSLDVDAPAPTVLGSRNADKLWPLDAPAPTVTSSDGGMMRDPSRPSRRPLAELAHALAEAGLLDRQATTVQADPRLAVAGHHERQQRGAVRLTVEQRAILQGFPASWAWPARVTDASRLVGNAVPPALAEAVGRAVAAALGRCSAFVPDSSIPAGASGVGGDETGRISVPRDGIEPPTRGFSIP